MRLYYITVTHPKEKGKRKQWQQPFVVLAESDTLAVKQVLEEEYKHYEVSRVDALRISVRARESNIVHLPSRMV